jgi:hypothetical protein
MGAQAVTGGVAEGAARWLSKPAEFPGKFNELHRWQIPVSISETNKVKQYRWESQIALSVSVSKDSICSPADT